MDLEENKSTSLTALIKRKNGNIIFFDTLVKLRCSDGIVLTLSKHRLDTFNFYKKIFTDEPDLEEIDCVHTSEEMLTLLGYINDELDVNIPLISKLMCYYDCTDSLDKDCVISTVKDITFLYPGTEDYFKNAIITFFDKIPLHDWLRLSDDYEFSAKTKIILHDAMMNKLKRKASSHSALFAALC